MNARHRQHLLVKELMEGLTVEPISHDEATLSQGGTTILRLKLDRTDIGYWTAQIANLRAQKWHRNDRMTEIVIQQTDILSFLAQPLPIGPQTHPWTLVLLDAVLDVAFRISAEFKHVFSLPRPNVLAPDIAPIIQTPAHGSFPSGHATEAFAVAAVMSCLFPDTDLVLNPRRQNLRGIAARIAVNRGYAGLHYPVDHHAGAVLGEVLGIVLATKLGATFATPTQDYAFEASDNNAANGFFSGVVQYAQEDTILPKQLSPIQSIASPIGASLLPYLTNEVLKELA